MSSNILRSEIRFGERKMVLKEVLMIHPRISLETFQLLSPAIAFFKLMESLSSPLPVGYTVLRVCNTISVRRCC